MYDRQCSSCEHKIIDCWEPITSPSVPCPKCGAATERAWLTKPAGVIGDDIPGGVLISHGICNPDGSPRRYYSNTEIRKAAEKSGLVNHVVHVPEKGSDKSKFTVRWV